MCKSEQRRLIQEYKKQFTPDQLRQLSAETMSHVECHPAFRAAPIIILYYSLPDEVFTHQFIDNWCQKKTILLPKVNGNGLTLHPYYSASSIQEGYMHITEPTTEAFTDYPSISLALIPGIAFDKNGYRLGRGMGFYDRLLANHDLSNTYKIGIAFPFQILPHICHEEHDIKMDEVIT